MDSKQVIKEKWPIYFWPLSKIITLNTILVKQLNQSRVPRHCQLLNQLLLP